MTMTNSIQAVVFDLGGVVLGSPLEGIADYENQHGIPFGFVNVNVVTRGESGAFQRLERGEMKMDDFYREFKRELEDPAQIQIFADFVKKPRKSFPEQLSFDTVELFRVMLERSMRADGDFIHAIYMLRGSGIKIAALTNNFAPMGSSAPGSINIHALTDLFDVIVESAVEQVRKPDPKAFLLTCKRLEVSPTRTVMMDDIGLNLRGAKGVGMETILVKLRDKQNALRQLEQLLLKRNNTKVRLVYSEDDDDADSPQRLFWNIASKEELEKGKSRMIVGDAYGFGANPPIVLLHGGGQTRHAWTSTCKRLASSGFFPIALDLKGHGESYWDELAAYKSSDYSRDVEPLIMRIGIANRAPLLVGASLGGLAILESPFCHSINVGGLCLVDVTPRLEFGGVQRVLQFMGNGMTNGFDTLEDVAKAVRNYQPHRVQAQDDSVMIDGLKRNLVFDEKRKKYVFHWDPAFLNTAEFASKEVLEQFEKDLLEKASHVKAPVLLLRGKLTDLISDQGIISLKRAIPHAIVRDVQNAGHMVAGDQNDRFCEELVRFANSLKDHMDKSRLALLPQGKVSSKL